MLFVGLTSARFPSLASSNLPIRFCNTLQNTCVAALSSQKLTIFLKEVLSLASEAAHWVRSRPLPL
jgi:hypothetical protein